MTTIKLRRDTAANWTAINPVLNNGEPGYETNTGFIKYGDGVTAWNSLSYFSGTAAADSDATLTFTDITTNNVTSTKHGFAPKSLADATKFLNSAATPGYANVLDSDLSTSDITTNNVSTSKHGFAPKGTGVATQYLDATGAYSTPVGSGTGDVNGPVSATDNALARFNTTTGKLIKNSGVLVDNSDNVTGMASLTLTNSGLHLLDTDASHDLIITPGSNLTVDRVLTITTGDAARTLDISAGSVTVSSFGSTLVDDASATAARTTLGLVIGTDVQAQDAELAALASVVSAANVIPVFTGSGTAGALTLAASQLAGRGSTGNIAAIVLGSNLSMSGSTLNATGGSGIATVTKQTFTSSGTYTPTANMVFCIVETVGGGGGAGDCTNNATKASGGGGGGGYARAVLTAATIGASKTVTIGAGGAHQAAGGTTSVGSTLASATGGSAGADGAVAVIALGGDGGIGTNGDFLIQGGCGLVGFPGATQTAGVGGTGGHTVYGAGGKGINTGTTGNAGVNYGGGGGGVVGGGGAATGGAGKAGIVIITEYCT